MITRRPNLTAYTFLSPALIMTALLVFLPLFWGIGISFTNYNQYNAGREFDTSYQTDRSKYDLGFVGLDNYKRILVGDEGLFQGREVQRFIFIFWQTALWTVVNVFFHFIFGLGLALLLNRQMKGRAIYRMLLLIPWAVPVYVSAFSWRWLFNSEYGLINLVIIKLGGEGIPWLSSNAMTMTAAIITNIWLGVPFMMVVLLGGLQSIPKELYESAWVDGANRFRQLFSITLPLLKPVALTATLLGAIWTFNMFNVIYLLQGSSRQVEILATYAYKRAFEDWQFGIATAYGVIILIVLLIFSSFYIRLLKGAGELD